VPREEGQQQKEILESDGCCSDKRKLGDRVGKESIFLPGRRRRRRRTDTVDDDEFEFGSNDSVGKYTRTTKPSGGTSGQGLDAQSSKLVLFNFLYFLLKER
jgi:hypothetical protein